MGEYPSALDLNRLKKKYHLSDSAITTSGFSENDLQTIYKNYLLRMVDLEDLKTVLFQPILCPPVAYTFTLTADG